MYSPSLFLPDCRPGSALPAWCFSAPAFVTSLLRPLLLPSLLPQFPRRSSHDSLPLQPTHPVILALLFGGVEFTGYFVTGDRT
eukprot:3937207-Pyramimonas_sp.AAC.1